MSFDTDSLQPEILGHPPFPGVRFKQMVSSIRALVTHSAGQIRKRWTGTFLARAVPIKSAPVRAHLFARPAHLIPESLSPQDSNDWIARAIASGDPSLISRFGSVELDSMMQWERISDWRLNEKAQWAFRTGDWPRWKANSFANLANNAGFFPADDSESVGRFYELYSVAARQIDLLGSWRNGEVLYLPQRPAVTRLGNLEPFFAEHPWTSELRGKRVLVIHPFSASIQKQYLKRRQLFSHPDFLPDFDLITLKAPYTFNGPGIASSPQNQTWFGVLENMFRKIESLFFDVAIIGAGAYGLPLGEFVKRNGSTAIHLGGATQLLFGIWGRRWSSSPSHQVLRNGNWVFPAAKEVPQYAGRIEKGAYW